MKVKICGITNLEDAMQAISFGADALGFQVGMRHKTEDEVSPEEAKAIVASLPPFVSYVMVTHLQEGCAAEQIVDRLKNYHSRVPIFKKLTELRKEGIVKDKSKKRRSYKYFIDVNDASISIPKQLEKIVNSFRDWLKSSEAKWQDVRKSEYKTFDKAQKDRDLIPTYVQRLKQLMSPDTYYAPLM
ncbi:MAG TPA: hypothetical protein VI278_08170 [Nitrososphaeraceae archaeon]